MEVAAVGSGARRAAATPLPLVEAEEDAAQGSEADHESNNSLHESDVSIADDDADEEEQEGQPPAAAGRGRGGTGRGRGAKGGDAGNTGRGGGKGRGRGRGRGAGRGGAQGRGPAAERYTWIDVGSHTFKERKPWPGEALPAIGPELAHLKWDAAPQEWFKAFDAPDAEYKKRAENSEKYRSYRHTHDLDGPNCFLK